MTMERRLLLDTYRTFGCESGDPTFRYSLLDGVRDGFLINPVVVDARTDITTQLLSDEGYAALAVTEDEEASEVLRLGGAGATERERNGAGQTMETGHGKLLSDCS